MPLRPGAVSLRDVSPQSGRNVWEKIGEKLGIKSPSFRVENKGDQAQLQAILSGIVSGEYQDQEIQEFAKLYPETAPFLGQAMRQREVFKSNFQQPKAPVYEGPETMVSPGQPGEADLGSAIIQSLGMGDVEHAKKLADLAATGARGGDKWEGPTLFDTDGNTYRATKQGTIEKVKVEGGAIIAPPVYPFQFTPPGGGPPVVGTITKPAAAKGGGINIHGIGAAQGEQNIKNVQEFKKQIAGINKLSGSLDALDSFLDKNGIQVGIGPFNADKTRQAETLHGNVQAELRTINDMGVLQPGELPFLEKLIADPSSWKRIGQKEGIKSQIKEMRERITRSKGIVEKQFLGEGAPTTPTPSALELTPAQQKLKSLLGGK